MLLLFFLKLIRSFLNNFIIKPVGVTTKKNTIPIIIGEIKKSSPSAGNIVKNYYPEELALIYEKAGVGAISILTEKNYFEGQIDHLSLIKKKRIYQY